MSIVTKITNRFVVGVTVIAFVITAVVPAGAQTLSREQIESLLANPQVVSFLQQFLSGSTPSTTTGTTTVVSSSACPYTWSQNLVIGSRGEDVRRLQQFLNSDPSTRVATSGVGSSGNETTYYGPATARAVSSFQEKYASSILTPLGLSRGTGAFYTSTRAQANSLCSSGFAVPSVPDLTVRPNTPTVSSGGLRVSAASQQSPDSLAIKGAQRVPFTKFVLTAEGGDVVVTGVKVKKTGLVEEELFQDVYLVDSSQQIIGREKGLNRDDEAIIGGTFVVRSGRPLELTVTANISNDDSHTYAGIGSLTVDDVRTESGFLDTASDSIRITGARHSFSDAVSLAKLEVRNNSSSSSTVELDDEEIELYDADFRAKEGDIRLYSITFEQKGSVDPTDWESGSINLEIKGRNRDGSGEFSPSVSGDNYIFTFGSNGILIEENDKADITLSGTLVGGVDSSSQFVIDEASDVYAVDVDYGYGVSVVDSSNNVADATELNGFDITNISGGSFTIRSDDFLRSSDRKIADGGDDQTFAAFELRARGEGYSVEDLDFTVQLTGLPSAFDFSTLSGDDLTIDSIYLETDGRTVAFANDDIEFTSHTSGSTQKVTLEFRDQFEVPVGDHEFRLRGDFDEEYPDGVTVEVETSNTNPRVEGLSTDKTVSLSNFAGRSFNDFDVEGNLVDSYIVRQANRSIVKDTSGVEVAEIRVDAEDSTRHVYLDRLTLPVTATDHHNDAPKASLNEVDDCVIEYDDQEISGYENASGTAANEGDGEDVTDQLRFDFDGSKGFRVDGGDRITLTVKCDIGDFASGHKLQFGGSGSELEYEIDGLQSSTLSLSELGPELAVSGSGTLNIAVRSKTNVQNLEVGPEGTALVNLGRVEIEARDEDIDIEEIVLKIESQSGVNVEDIIDELALSTSSRGSSADVMPSQDKGACGTAAESDQLGCVEFDSLDDFNVLEGTSSNIYVFASFNGIDQDATSTSGSRVEVSVVDIKYVGSSSNETSSYTNLDGNNQNDISNPDLATSYVYRSLPTFSADQRDASITSSTGTTIYEFEVSGSDSGKVSLETLTVTSDLSGVTLANTKLFAYSNSSRTSGIDEADNEGQVGSTVSSPSSGVSAFSFSTPIELSVGETIYFRVKGDIGDAGDDGDSMTTRLTGDAFLGSGDNTGVAAASASGAMIFSPHSDGGLAVGLTETDWFKGAGLISVSDFDSWTLSR